MAYDLRDHRYFLVGVRLLLGLLKGLGWLGLSVVWLACLSSFGLYGYAAWVMPSAATAAMLQGGCTLALLGLSLHAVAGLAPFPQLERLVVALWKGVRHD